MTFFLHGFFTKFGRILQGLGKVLGRFWGTFWRPKRIPKGQNDIFQWECDFQKLLGRFGERLERFGKGFGKVLERSGNFLGALGTPKRCFNNFLWFFMCLVAFWLFFCCFCLIIAYFVCFLRLLLFTFAKLCWDEFQVFWLEVACFYYSNMCSLFLFLAQTNLFIGL